MSIIVHFVLRTMARRATCAVIIALSLSLIAGGQQIEEANNVSSCPVDRQLPSGPCLPSLWPPLELTFVRDWASGNASIADVHANLAEPALSSFGSYLRSPPIRVGSRRQLFVDDFGIEVCVLACRAATDWARRLYVYAPAGASW